MVVGQSGDSPTYKLVTNETMCVMRKQYKPLDYSENKTNPLFMNGLSRSECKVLSGRESLKRAYLETI